ncbi:hypothetical protein F2Q69_00027425 [Brassica cretica]|uniref:Uncharacterized protein n=1 Tax=Brassica cretica TaxID=69181 RepID=A0A8S9RXV3_BRACR|nr:hypothetical protein F2Q69_00027425 [Brassica cretica]
MVETEDWPNINLVVESREVKIDREISKNEVVEELIHDGLEARRFRRRTFLQHEVFRETLYQRNIISNTLEAGRKLSRTGIKHDGIEARRENPKLDETLISPDIWEEWWRPACVLEMQPAMWSTRCRRACVRSHAKRHTGCHQPEADWLLSSINRQYLPSVSTHPDLSKPTPREGSVQLKVNQVKISSDGKQVNVAREGERNKVVDLEYSRFSPRRPVLTLSPNSGLGTGLDLVCISLLFPLLEARSWQEAKSNLVTVALGKDDQIAWSWTLGPPV